MSPQSVLDNFKNKKFFQQAHYLVSNENVSNEYLSTDKPALVKDIYDIASLTKIFVTGTMLFDALGQKKLFLNTPISEFKVIQNYSKAPSTKRITIADLVSHTSGIAPWFPLYCLDKKELAPFFDLVLQSVANDQQRRYSDLDMMLLGFILEEALGEKIDVWFERKVIQHLGLTKTGFAHQLKNKENVVATSLGNPFELYLAQKTLNTWQEKIQNFGLKVDTEQLKKMRTHRLIGECNDGNANFLNGISSHAGLFSTPKELLKISNSWPKDAIKQFIALSTPGREYLFCFSEETLQWGKFPEFFGHHGFTGCSFAINQELNQTLIFCSNRQYYGLDAKNDYPAWKLILREL